MKKILYIPLDERPCNYLYPRYMLNVRNDYKLITPPVNVLGYKKEKADIEKIWEFVFDNATTANAVVMSAEMMIYGGLLPSRIHYLNNGNAEKYVQKIREIKSKNKDIKIYISNLIMRTPKYNSSDEEPDYYEEYGENIFKRAYFLNKKERIGLNNIEETELNYIIENLPVGIIKDYENRRDFNLSINIEILKLLKDGMIDFLSIPQDDSSEYGYTAIDQRKIIQFIKENKLQRKAYMYPGADEVGASLIARAINEMEDRKLKIYPLFSSTLGPQIIPLYEDRLINESLKAHILVTGNMMTTNIAEADIILAYNTPGKIMQESWEQDKKDITYTSFRNLIFFVEKIKNFMDMGKPVIVADSAFSNGGDLEFLSLLDQYGILDKLLSYKGWNTNCNTLGTTIAAGTIAFGCEDRDYIKKNLIYHILDDVFYQAVVRMDVTNNLLPKLGLNYFSIKGGADIVKKETDKKLEECYNMFIQNSFQDIEAINVDSFSPWCRMFEIGINLTVKLKGKVL